MSLPGRPYTASWAPQARTTAFDVFEFTPADDKPIQLAAVVIGQTSEITDAQDEQLEIQIIRGGTAMTSGSAGTGSTAAANGVAMDASNQASGFTFDAGNTTVATFTGGVTLYEDTMNVRSGFQLWLPPELWIGCSQANGGIVVRMNSTPADSVTFDATAFVVEAG